MTPCPQCGLNCELPVPAGMKPPSERAVAICIACGAINKFVTGTWDMRTPTVEELDEELRDPQTKQLITEAARVRATRTQQEED